MNLEIPKLFDIEKLREERGRLQRASSTLVMTNGCFDLLHTGHIFFLQQARRLGDRLLVAVNSDASVKSLKGPNRPVQSETERAFALSALQCVDYVLIFQTPDLAEEISAILPDVYCKAGDYTLQKLHPGERAALEEGGARISFLPFLEGFSTTTLLERIRRAGGTA